MSLSLVPVVDSGNPMYCPTLPASRCLSQLHKMKHACRAFHTTSRPINLGSRRESLRPSVQSFNIDDTPSVVPCTLPVKPSSKSSHKRKSGESLHCRSKRIRSDISEISSFILSPDQNQLHLPTLLQAAPIQDSSDGYCKELLKKVKSQLPMAFSRVSPRHVAAIERELYGHAIGSESPEDVSYLLETLSQELPGISLTQQLSYLERISHQDIVDLLGKNGHLARHILEYFRRSLIHSLDLSASLLDEDGLNLLKPNGVLDVFTLPHSFSRLRTLNLNHVHLDDFDLTRIHHLPSLDTLYLNNTGIGNEAIGHLTTLKYQLEELHIDNNERVNDDCTPSLCLFQSLVILRLYGTNIQMPGLRRLAISVGEVQREIDIEIPRACDTYLNSLHSHYLLYPSAPLITDPRLCASLSTNALKENLEAHAAFNPSIYLSGSKMELVERLERILEDRQADLVVKKVVWGYESFDK